jgi:hypothetical protein
VGLIKSGVLGIEGTGGRLCGLVAWSFLGIADLGRLYRDILLETGASSLFGSGRRGGDFEASACCLTDLYLEYFTSAGGEAVSFSSDIFPLS